MINLKNDFDINGYIKCHSSDINFNTDEMMNIAFDFIDQFSKSPNCRVRDINIVDGQVNSFHRLHECDALMKIYRESGILDLCATLLNDDVEIRAAELFAKPGKVGLKVPFHQDNFLWCLEQGKALTVWIACKPVSVLNGGITYAVGSHKFKTVNHVPSNHPGTSQMISPEYFEKIALNCDFITPSLNKGDFLIHHSELLHGSDANQSIYPRHGLTIQVKAKNDKYDLNKLKAYEDSLQDQINSRK